ncbi:hypothetical protein [Treponema ruminis]|uniref:Uncharacterized protein n=1 Tax=Treponema ruminis TaxID=744515 RepID=A0A7W8G6Y9_9SPIR|nr:hypothetical protein [Treponema ruminis]MBB5224955.1 hypothetical protein [Treponema ruminis]
MSKKVWNSCKKIFISAMIFCASAFSLPAQKKADEKPNSVTMPSMPKGPSLSMPSVGSGFYSPGRSDFYSGAKPVAPKTPKTPSSQAENTTQSHTVTSTNGQNQSTDPQKAQTEAKKLNTLAKSASSSLNMLSADDISSLSNLGAFSQLSGLLGRGNSNLESKLLESQNTVTASTVDSATLKQILSELTELKNRMASATGESVTKTSERKDDADVFSNVTKKEPKILRFVVNGYDLLATCKKIYFSDLETDGTFLMTGDRKYLSENKVRTETFYFYFRAKANDNGIIKYAVTPAVSQDYENEYSYLYQLTKKTDLSADRTGNLVTVRVSEGSWNMDLLISLDK